MHLTVDQSSRIEILTEDSIIACANGDTRTILISRKVKRQLFEDIQTQYRSVRLPELRIFAAGLYVLLKPFLNSLQNVTIDYEYEGHHGEIKGMLLNHIRSDTSEFDKKSITFASIGKKASAHKVAISTYRKEKEADYTASLAEMRELLNLK